jgi:hypothetical protein
MTQKPPSPRIFNPELSTGVETVLMKALEKKPEKRYQSGAKLVDALETALTRAAKPSARLALPPIPVDVPTIKRRTVSRNTVAQRVASRPLEGAKPVLAKAKHDTHVNRYRNSLRWRWTIALILAVAAVLWFGFNNLMADFSVSTPTASTTDSTTQTLFVTEPASSAAGGGLPLASATYTPVSVTAAVTALILPSSTPTLTLTVEASPAPTSTARYLEGNLFVFYYDANTFAMVNKSKASRSVSAFTFERLDHAGNTLGTFFGWKWETQAKRGLSIFPKTCVAILVTDDQTYLQPAECERGFLGIVYYDRAENIDEIFWTAQADSTEFRVLWQGIEVGRCEIAASECELLMP